MSRTSSPARPVPGPVEAGGPAPVAYVVPPSVYEATRALLRIRLSAEAVIIISRAISEMGGEALAEGATPSGRLVEAYLGPGYQIRACAPEGSPTLHLIERYLPLLVEDARCVLSTVGAVERLARQAGIDRVTGLPNHNSLSRLFSRLHIGDVIVAIALNTTMSETAPAQQDAGSDDLVRAFAQALRRTLRKTDHCGRMGGEGFMVVLKNEPAAAAERLLGRLQSVWEQLRPAPIGFCAGIATVTASGWRAAMSAAEAALCRIKEAGEDGWETANDADHVSPPSTPEPPPAPPSDSAPPEETTASKAQDGSHKMAAGPTRRHFFRPGWANSRPEKSSPGKIGRQTQTPNP